MEKTAKRFNTRAFVALMIAFSGIGLPITGIANHIYQYSPMITGRHSWMASHNVLSILFVVFSVWHILLNRKPLLVHVKGLASQVPSVSREAILAGIVVAVALFLAAGHAFHVQ